MEEGDEETDAELIRRCRGQGPEGQRAFDVLFARYRHPVYRLARTMCDSHEDAEEACQDVFNQAYGGLDGFREEASFQTWLHRITVRLCWRKQRLAAARREREEEIRRQLAIDLASGSRTGAGSWGNEWIGRWLARLSLEEQRALLVWSRSGMNMRETARALGTRLSAAKMRVYRARNAVRESSRAQGRLG